MHYRILVTLLTLAILFTPRTGVAFRFQQDPATPQKTAESRDKSEADRLSEQVRKLYQESRLDEAMPIAKRVIKLREKELGSHHYLVGDAVSDLAMLYIAAEDYAEAEGPLKRALGIYERDPDRNAVLIAKILDSLGLLRTLKREYKEAEKLYVRAIAIKEKSLGVNHREFLASLNALADLFVRQRDYKQAELALHRVVQTTGVQLGETSRESGLALERLACAQFKNQSANAEQTDERANKILYREAAQKAEPVKLESKVFECRLINELRPDFANVARSGRFLGSTSIVFAVEADETGTVTSARMVSGNPIFEKAMQKAVMGAKLRPMIVDGKPVKVNGTIVRDYAVMVMTRTVVVPVTGMGRP